MPVATEEKNGLMNASLAFRKVTLNSSEKIEIPLYYYGLVLIKEEAQFGTIVIIQTLWSKLNIISSESVNKSFLSFQSNNNGGLVIINNGDTSVSLTIRVLI